MSDLVRGSYPLTSTAWKRLGKQPNATQANLAARSNLEFPGMGSLQDAAAAVTSGDLTVVPVPVEVGDPISLVDVLVGATAAVTPTHSFAALYNAAGVLVGAQSADGGAGAIAASGRFTFTLGSTYIIQPADAQYGYLYVAVSVTAGTVPSLVSGSVPTATQYAAYANAPAFMAATEGSAEAGVAPAALPGSPTKQSAVPIVVLR